MAVQANSKSNGAMDLIPIGEAARLLRLNPSALRYYDERGLVPVTVRRGGRRWYGRHELRRLAFITIAARLGIPLDTAAKILDAPGPRWRQAVREQITALDDLIEQARGARTFLEHALRCPSEHPTRDCPSMTAALDLLVDGGTIEQLAKEQFHRRADTPDGPRPADSTGDVETAPCAPT